MQTRWEDGSDCYAFRNLWPLANSVGTGLPLNRSLPGYCKVCRNKKEFGDYQAFPKTHYFSSCGLVCSVSAY